MNVALRISNLQTSTSLEAHVARKLELAVQRFADRLERVLVRLVDVNGPRGGLDKRCRMAAKLSGEGPTIHVEATDADAYVAVTRAAARLQEQVSRSLARQSWAAAARLEHRRRSREEAFASVDDDPPAEPA